MLLFLLLGAFALYLILRAFAIWRHRSCQLYEAGIALGIIPAVLLSFVKKPVTGTAARLVAALYWFMGTLCLIGLIPAFFCGAFGELRGPAKGLLDKMAAKFARNDAPAAAATSAAQSPAPPASSAPSATDPAPLGRAAIQQLSAAEYPAFITRPGRVTVIDFHADWCGPCRTLGPVLERVVAGFGSQAALGKLNVDQVQQLAAKAGVKAIPDVRIMVNGQVVDQFVGAIPEDQVRERIARQVAKLPAPALAAEPAAAPSTPATRPVNPIVPMEKDWLPAGIERREKARPK